MATWAVAGLLAAASLAVCVVGIGSAWAAVFDDAANARDGDFDMRDRAAEYQCFRQGTYPNRRIAGPEPPSWLRHSPYPPYAFPMFAVFFEPGGEHQGRLLLEGLSLVALVVMGCFGRRDLAFGGPAMAVIGALMGVAIMGNKTAFELGHFSIICMGLIVGQVMLLDKGRPIAAGICWALAMIKPQIALVFVPLFMINRQWRGLVAGGLLLAACGLFTCWWTDVAPLRAVSCWYGGLGQSGTISTAGQGVGPGSIAAALGVDPRQVHMALLTVLGGAMAFLCWQLVRPGTEHRDQSGLLVPLAGICAVLGEVCLYHYHYDNVMLFPTAVAMLTLAVAMPVWWSRGLATLMMATLWIPHRYITAVPYNGIGRTVIWLAVAAVLTAFSIDAVAVRRTRRTARW
jgi:hypothetical protein